MLEKNDNTFIITSDTPPINSPTQDHLRLQIINSKFQPTENSSIMLGDDDLTSKETPNPEKQSEDEDAAFYTPSQLLAEHEQDKTNPTKKNTQHPTPETTSTNFKEFEKHLVQGMHTCD